MADDGTVLGVRGPLYGRRVRLEEMPAHLPQAFLAIEDRRFFEHDGVDYRGLARAFWVNVRAGRTVQGGSTLTMQLVKNLVLTPERSLRRKIQEIRLALALERALSKQEILELYLNRVYLGEQAFGVEAAARRYFNTTTSELSLQESALLAALPKAPTRLAPTENMAEALARARRVLSAMQEAGFIDPIAYLTAASIPAELAEGLIAPEEAQGWGHVFDAAQAEALRILGENGGAPDLVIITTIDPRLQRAAQLAVNGVLDEQGAARRAGEGALAAIAPDGAVRALVGGRDYRASQFNRATQARRQPGSAFKPIVYAAAFEAGMDPASPFEDRAIDIEGWSPGNFGGGFRGRITLADALKRSINTVAAQAGVRAGLPNVTAMAGRLGVVTPLNPVPAVTLGSGEVRLLELTGAYNVFARDGRRFEPFLVREIRSARGELIWQAPETGSGEEAISVEHARWMSTMLQSVVIDGTGTRARIPGHRAAGKTGTSQSSRDAWFVGYSAHLTAGVWVGNDDDSPMNNVTGGQLPAEIWRRFMVEAHTGVRPAPLSAPEPRQRSERDERLAAFYASLSERFDAMLPGSGG
ncbi:PBP1A family penicillin-binding protein [Alkalicaulis satelles]|uniref:PBP1A family penicillin-binding protein n=2 Tax=Alkalicaulis satelles TaxID=2609175 RepID=A0A5M6ZDE7_9PROT|nr:PBP1A family penicillin-binding protein [Alkalicaulis satelles]